MKQLWFDIILRTTPLTYIPTPQVLADNQGNVLCSRPDEACPRGFYKVMSFVTEETVQPPAEVEQAGQAISFLDYHFYMQHKDMVMRLNAGDNLMDVST